MTLDKAIEILEVFSRQTKGLSDPDYTDAVELGIEALKRILDSRKLAITYVLLPLAEETKD